MTNNETARRMSKSLAWPTALLGAAAVVGLWLWLGSGISVTIRLGSAAGTLITAGGIVWLFRARANRRRNAALDAYAEREIARAQRRLAWTRVKSYSTPGSFLPTHHAAKAVPLQLLNKEGLMVGTGEEALFKEGLHARPQSQAWRTHCGAGL
jgi:hypothetical protein